MTPVPCIPDESRFLISMVWLVTLSHLITGVTRDSARIPFVTIATLGSWPGTQYDCVANWGPIQYKDMIRLERSSQMKQKKFFFSFSFFFGLNLSSIGFPIIKMRLWDVLSDFYNGNSYMVRHLYVESAIWCDWALRFQHAMSCNFWRVPYESLKKKKNWLILIDHESTW